MENKNNDASVETAAARWVELVLAHIEAKKQQSSHTPKDKDENKNE